MTEVPATRTPWSNAALVASMATAWRMVFGEEPGRSTLAKLWAQSALETKRGASCWGNNPSNIMGADPETGCYHVLGKAPECAVDPYAIPGATPLASSHVVCAPGTSPYLPAGGSRFRAYPSLVRGCIDKIRVLLALWPEAAEALRAGTVAAFVSGLIRGVDDKGNLPAPGRTGRRYMTADPPSYEESMESLVAEILRTLAETDWPKPPIPAADGPITAPQTPKSKSAPRMAAVRPSTPPPVHLPPQGATLRANGWGHAYALTEAPPATDALSVIRWLAVTKSPRYAPKPGVTFCNIYAVDFCNAMGAYLPRCWWNDPVKAALATPPAILGGPLGSVHELSANGLFRWLTKWSEAYGWERLSTLDAAQDAANEGRAVVICARRLDEAQPGHIGCVAPSSDACRALRGPNGAVMLPVQSMAGGQSALLELGHGNAWWRGTEFAEWGIWAHRGEAPITIEHVADGRTQPLFEHLEGEHTVATEDPEL